MTPLVIRLANGIVLWVEKGRAWHVDTQFAPKFGVKPQWFDLEVTQTFFGGRIAQPDDVEEIVERFGRPVMP